LVDKNIEVAFGYNKLGPYSPIYKYAKKHEDFNIVFEKYEKNCGYRALKYAANTNNMGVIISASTIGFTNIMTPIGAAHLAKRPLLLLSFFDPERELKISPFPQHTKHYIKESITLKNTKNFSADMESLISYGYEFPAGPVHLNVSNKILDEPLEFATEKFTSVQLPTRKPVVHQSVKAANDLCVMHIVNQQKIKREPVRYMELIDMH
jgi:thiamine pyrophosphate-dependent acetolactate synthase large subunit-like protein